MLYKSYIKYCENIINDYINLKIANNEEDKNSYIDSIINNYKNILKFSSNVGDLNLDNLEVDDEEIDILLKQLDDLSHINAKKTKIKPKIRNSVNQGKKISIFSAVQQMKMKKK